MCYILRELGHCKLNTMVHQAQCDPFMTPESDRLISRNTNMAPERTLTSYLKIYESHSVSKIAKCHFEKMQVHHNTISKREVLNYKTTDIYFSKLKQNV